MTPYFLNPPPVFIFLRQHYELTYSLWPLCWIKVNVWASLARWIAGIYAKTGKWSRFKEHNGSKKKYLKKKPKKKKKKLLKLSPEQWNVSVANERWVGKCHYAKFSRSRLEACGRLHLVSAFSSELLRLVFAVTTCYSHKSWPYCALCRQFSFTGKVNVMFLPCCSHSSAFPALQNWPQAH